MPGPIRHPHTKRITCGHRIYGMGCADLDELYEFAKHACQICRRHERRVGVLHIDHDPPVGGYAVRGLLCGWCNTNLPWWQHWDDSELRERAGRFLAQPWYRRPGGPRPLGRARYGVAYGKDAVHVVRNTWGWRSIGHLGNRSHCGVQLGHPRQAYQVDAANLCGKCVARIVDTQPRLASPQPWWELGGPIDL